MAPDLPRGPNAGPVELRAGASGPIFEAFVNAVLRLDRVALRNLPKQAARRSDRPGPLLISGPCHFVEAALEAPGKAAAGA